MLSCREVGVNAESLRFAIMMLRHVRDVCDTNDRITVSHWRRCAEWCENRLICNYMYAFADHRQDRGENYYTALQTQCAYIIIETGVNVNDTIIRNHRYANYEIRFRYEITVRAAGGWSNIYSCLPFNCAHITGVDVNCVRFSSSEIPVKCKQCIPNKFNFSAWDKKCGFGLHTYIVRCMYVRI